ncbi:MAG: 4Fe-4S dicluster domain-containing protein [Planctomycetota bacterium]|jgi:ferredoxin-type protein NapG/ferredoxin-type protein NapH
MVEAVENMPRRKFLGKVGRSGVRLGAAGGLLYAIQSMFKRPASPRPIEESRMGILRPPGALEEEAFLESCIRCELCAQACDTACIRLFAPWEGRHAGSPFIRAAERACNLCLACTQVCPSGALSELVERTEVRMGTAIVDERLCVSHNGTGACGACHTICPLRNKAISQGLFNKPTVHAEFCVGCGLCEEACIVDDRRAIQVSSGRSWS